MLTFMIAAEHWQWPRKVDLEFLQARHPEAAPHWGRKVHHDNFLRTLIFWAGCLWCRQQFGLLSCTLPFSSNRRISLLLFLADGGTRHGNTGSEPGAISINILCFTTTSYFFTSNHHPHKMFILWITFVLIFLCSTTYKLNINYYYRDHVKRKIPKYE